MIYVHLISCTGKPFCAHARHRARSSSSPVWPPNLAGWYNYRDWIKWEQGVGDVIKSGLREKLKTYLHFQSAFGQQIWQYSNLPWWAPAHKVIWHSDHVVLRDHITHQNYFISTATVPMATRLGRMVTNFEGLLYILLDLVLTWSWEIK